jgi:hypothetical protein
MEPSPAASWYPDPAGLPQLRWWDGAQWTGWTSNGLATRRPKTRSQKVVLGVTIGVIVILVGMVTVFGLSGSQAEDYRAACNSDATAVGLAIAAYHADNNGAWPPAGPIDKTSVLLRPFRYLKSAPSSDKYSINTDGLGTVLVAIPPARTGGLEYSRFLHESPLPAPGAKDPCDALN